MSVILAFGRLRWKEQKFKACLGYIVGWVARLYGAAPAPGAIHFLVGLEFVRFPAVGGVGASP